MGLACSARKPKTNELTDDEITAIRDVAKSNNVGRKILQTLIEKRPKFAEYFGIQAESLDIKTLNQVKEFQLQSHRIQNFLDTAVGSLGFCPIASIHDMAHRIGQIHYYKFSRAFGKSMMRGVNFGAENWLVFKKVTVDQVTLSKEVLLELERRREEAKAIAKTIPNAENGQPSGVQSPHDSELMADLLNPNDAPTNMARQGWNKLMTIIIREMKRGFLEEAMRNCKEDDSVTRRA